MKAVDELIEAYLKAKPGNTLGSHGLKAEVAATLGTALVTLTNLRLLGQQLCLLREWVYFGDTEELESTVLDMMKLMAAKIRELTEEGKG